MNIEDMLYDWLDDHPIVGGILLPAILAIVTSVVTTVALSL
jgi:hypothetical protein